MAGDGCRVRISDSDLAAVVPRDLISEQLLEHPSFVQMWAALAKGATGGKHHSGRSLSFSGIC